MDTTAPASGELSCDGGDSAAIGAMSCSAADAERTRCPTAIARSRNWLLTALDESVHADEVSLDRELDDAIGDLRRWREEQARRVEEMQKAALAEFPASAPAPAAVEADSSPARCRPRAPRRAATPDENACDDPRGMRAAPAARAHPPAPPRATASERVALAQQEQELQRLQEVADSAPWLLSQPDMPIGLPAADPHARVGWPGGMQDCWREEAEMERNADALLDYSSNLEKVLAKMHALEAPRNPPHI